MTPLDEIIKEFETSEKFRTCERHDEDGTAMLQQECKDCIRKKKYLHINEVKDFIRQAYQAGETNGQAKMNNSGRLLYQDGYEAGRLAGLKEAISLKPESPGFSTLEQTFGYIEALQAWESNIKAKLDDKLKL